MKHAVLASLFALVASAATINFDNPSGPLGTSQIYTSGTYTVTAYGFSSALTPTDLYGKHDGGDENGVGLYHFPDNEIAGSGFVEITIANFIGLAIEFGSATDGEHWKVGQSNTLGQFGSTILTGSDEGVFHNISTADAYITVMATSGTNPNVLLEALKVEGVATPEPNVGYLFVGGLALIICGRARHWRNKA